MMIDVLQTLTSCGCYTPPLRIPESFQTCPGDVRELMRICQLPPLQLGDYEKRKILDFEINNAQGVEYGGNDFCYLSSEKDLFKYRFVGGNPLTPTSKERVKQVRLQNVVQQTGLNPSHFDHLSDLSYFDGCLFTLVEDHRPDIAKEDKESLLLCLSEDLDLIGFSRIPYGRNADYHHDAAWVGWCAVNPWDRLLYTHTTDPIHFVILGYNVEPFYQIRSERERWGRYVPIERSYQKIMKLFSQNHNAEELPSYELPVVHEGRVVTWHQGGMFSQNGKFYFSCSLPNNFVFGSVTGWKNAIRVYDSLSGTFLREVVFDFEGNSPEIEGISLHPSGFLYIAVCENDIETFSDDQFHVYTVTFPGQTL